MSVATQMDWDAVELERQWKEEIRQKIRKAREERNGFTGLINLLDIKWPEMVTSKPEWRL